MTKDLNPFDEVQRAAQAQKRKTFYYAPPSKTTAEQKIIDNLESRGCSPEFARACAMREVRND